MESLNLQRLIFSPSVPSNTKRNSSNNTQNTSTQNDSSQERKGIKLAFVSRRTIVRQKTTLTAKILTDTCIITPLAAIISHTSKTIWIRVTRAAGFDIIASIIISNREACHVCPSAKKATISLCRTLTAAMVLNTWALMLQEAIIPFTSCYLTTSIWSTITPNTRCIVVTRFTH